MAQYIFQNFYLFQLIPLIFFCNGTMASVYIKHFGEFKNQRYSSSSSSETSAYLRIVFKVDFLIGSWRGTVSIFDSLCKITWLPFCLTTIKPSFSRAFITFFPETEGNLVNWNLHYSNFAQHKSLFSCYFQNKLDSFLDVFKRFFLSISFTDSGRNL